MTVNMKTLKAGDTVKFHCDGEAVVSSVQSIWHSHESDVYEVNFEPKRIYAPVNYNPDGTMFGKYPVFDIVEIVPKKVEYHTEIIDYKENHGLAFDLTGVDGVSSYKITINKADPHDCKIEYVGE